MRRPRGPFATPVAILALLAGVLLPLLLAPGRAAASQTDWHPAELVALPGGDLWVIDEDGSLLDFDPASGRARRLTERSLPYRAHDATLRGSGDGLRVYVLMTREAAKGVTLHRIVAYAPPGRQVAEWTTTNLGIIGGMVADPGVPRLFLTDAQKRRVYSLDLRRKGAAPDGVGPVFRATRLGAIALDAEGGRLFVADPARSRILALPQAGGASVEVGDDVGLPVALVVDRPRGRLLVLDGLNGRVWAIPLAGEGGPVAAADLPDWGDPSGLEVTAEGHIWVTDRSLGTLTELTAEGDLVRVVDLDALPVR